MVCSITIPACGRLGFDPLATDDPDVARFEVEEVAQDDLLIDRNLRIAIPPSSSTFPPGVYLAAGGLGTPPQVFRVYDGAVELFAGSDGVSGPDEGVAQIAFAPPAYGDRMFVCAASVNAGDGVFTLDASGTFAGWSTFNNCNGLAFDDARVLDDPGFSPLYVDVNASAIDRFAPSTERTRLVDDLAYGATGWKLYLHGGDGFARGLYLVFPVDGNRDPAGGAIWFAPPGMPLTAAPLLAIPGPYAAAFGGDRFDNALVVSSSVDGAITAIRPDLSRFTLLDGLAGEADLAFDGDTLWVTEQATGRLLAIRPR